MTLTDEEFQALLVGMGAAMGMAFKKGLRSLAYQLVRLANEANKDNPDFIPYEIPPEFAHGSGDTDNANAQSDRSSGVTRGKGTTGSVVH
jgi:hypothetical protein